MGIVRKIKDTARWVENVAEEEAPRPKPADAKPAPPKKKPDDAKLMRGLGERIGFAGIVAFTVGAALLGAAGCRLGDSTPSARPTCDEPASWCDAAGTVQR